MTDPMLATIPGTTAQHNLNRVQDCEDNIANVRKEFLGKPEVCHHLAGIIVRLRRDTQDVEQRKQFWDTVTKYKSTLLLEYDVRWLLSVCDTIIDIGNNVQRAVAMNITQCINGTNIHHTLLVNAHNGNLDNNKLAHEIKVPTWGGMQTADIPTGDRIYNMMTRLDSVIRADELLWDIWCEIKTRGKQSNVIMNYVCGASRFEHQRSYFQ
jgi:hypothetical protein